MNSALLEPEVWVPAAGLSKYEVSSHGRLRRAAPGASTRVGRIIPGKPEKQRKGYLRACLMGDDGKAKSVSLHRLICATFHGPAPTGRHHAAHRDGVNTHNWPSNLKWATPQENEADKLAHGRRATGSRHGAARLTEADVRLIRREAAKVGRKGLAERFDVHPLTIDYIVSRRTWRHVA